MLKLKFLAVALFVAIAHAAAFGPFSAIPRQQRLTRNLDKRAPDSGKIFARQNLPMTR